MIFYAIKNRRNGRYLSGTDFRSSPPRQILCDTYHPPRLFSGAEIVHELRHREVNMKTYKVEAVQVKAVE